jgi:hypothetical protein
MPKKKTELKMETTGYKKCHTQEGLGRELSRREEGRAEEEEKKLKLDNLKS